MATADPLRVKDDVPTVCAIGVDRRVVGGTLTHRFCCGGNASEPRGCPCFWLALGSARGASVRARFFADESCVYFWVVVVVRSGPVRDVGAPRMGHATA